MKSAPLVSAVLGLLLILTPLQAQQALPQSRSFYVSPAGRADGDGSRSRPWDLGTALAHPRAVKPGDTIWLRGGTYQGAFQSRLTGSPQAPVTVRQYPDERAVLDGGAAAASVLTVAGSWAVYWGFEIMRSDPERTTATQGSHPRDLGRGVSSGIVVLAPSSKFINLLVHDAGVGVGFWRSARDSELYGNLIFYNGWDGPDRGHGHGIYTQNETGIKRIIDNVVFEQYGSGLIVYGSSAASLNNYRIEGNVLFNNGGLSARSGFSKNLLVGGNALAQNIEVVENFTYYPPGRGGENNLGETAGIRLAMVEGNILVGDTALEVSGSVLDRLRMQSNLFIGRVKGFSPQRYPENIFFPPDQRPRGVRVFVRPNQYEPGRAHIIIYNFDLLPRVAVDLSKVLSRGDRYEIRDAQDYFGPPVATGTYRGQAVRLPMQLTHLTAPVGYNSSPLLQPTTPEFAVFVLLKRGR